VWSYVAGGATGSLAEYSATIGTAWLFDETESVSYNPYDAAAFTVGGALTGGLIYGAGVVWQKTTNLAAGQFRQEAAATIQKAINGLRNQTQNGTAHNFGPNTLGAAHVPPPRVLQTGGHTITDRTRKALDLTPDQAKRAMEAIKRSVGQSSKDHSHKILSNGDVLDSHTGELFGNLFDFLN